MSLTDLRQRYDRPEQTVEERLRLLETAATHLPAPEFLWYPVALEALGSEEVRLRRAALSLLAFAPQSWDQVLVTAITSSDADLQRRAIAALATHARAWPELVDAFSTLGELPGWLPQSLDVWRQALTKLLPANAEAEVAAAERVALQAQLEASVREREELQARLGTTEERLSNLEGRLGESETALEAERHGAQAIAERMEKLIAAHDADAEQWNRDREAHTALQQRHRTVLIGSGVAAAILLVVGLPLAWTLGTHQAAPAVMAATSPMAPPEMEDELKAAEEGGYRKALAALADHAGALSHEGHLYPAVAVWQAYARLAPTPTEARQGTHQSDLLLARLQKTTPGAQIRELTAHKPRTLTRTAAAAAPRVLHAPRETHRSLVQPTHTSRHIVRAVPPLELPTPPSPAVAQPIPDQVRAKF